MRNSALLIKLLLFFCFPATVLGQESDLDFVAASPTLNIDLDKSPATLAKTIVPQYFDYIRSKHNENVQKRFNEGLKNYLVKLKKKMFFNYGQLIKVQQYSDEFGTNILPVDFLQPLAIGTDPVDAYSEYINRPFIRSAKISGPTDVSYYLWITKENGLLSVGQIPRELSDLLVRRANQVAMDKVTNAGKYNSNLSVGPNPESTAAYWNTQLKTFENELKQEGTTATAKALSDKFDKLQLENSQLVADYKRMEYRLENNKSMINTAEILLELASIVSDNSTTAKDEKLSFDIGLVRATNKTLEKNIFLRKKEIDTNNKDIMHTEKELRHTFRRHILY